jgi:ribokinase
VTGSPIALFVGDFSLDTTVLVDHAPDPDEKVVASGMVEDCGGVVANAAVACHLAGQRSEFLCATGDDPAAGTCRSRLAARGVAVRDTPVAGPTTRALITLDTGGEKRLVLAKGVTMYPPVAACDAVDLDGVAWVHTALYDAEAAIALTGRCQHADVPWSIDLEPATIDRGLDLIASCLRGAETVFVNSRAATLLGETPDVVLFEAGVRTVVFTGGPDGARWRSPAERVTVGVPPAIGPVVDSTGAGDCLAGSFVARRLQGEAPAAALTYAVLAASLSCTRLGVQGSYPERAAVQNLMTTAS